MHIFMQRSTHIFLKICANLFEKVRISFYWIQYLDFQLVKSLAFP